MKAKRPKICLKLENEFDIKFKGPFADGREWDAVIKTKNQFLTVQMLNDIFHYLYKHRSTKQSGYCINMNFAIKIDKDTVLGINATNKQISMTVFHDC